MTIAYFLICKLVYVQFMIGDLEYVENSRKSVLGQGSVQLFQFETALKALTVAYLSNDSLGPTQPSFDLAA